MAVGSENGTPTVYEEHETDLWTFNSNGTVTVNQLIDEGESCIDPVTLNYQIVGTTVLVTGSFNIDPICDEPNGNEHGTVSATLYFGSTTTFLGFSDIEIAGVDALGQDTITFEEEIELSIIGTKQ